MKNQLLLLICLLAFSRCEKPIIRGNCASSGPLHSFPFLLVDPSGSAFINDANKDSVKISYTSKGNDIYLSDLRFMKIPQDSSEYVGLTSELLIQARQSNATLFNIKIGAGSVGTLQVATLQSDCDNIIPVSTAKFNGQTLPYDKSTGYLYVIHINR